MSIYTRIYDDQVFELIETDGDISTLYHPSMVWVCVDGIKPMPTVGWKAIKSDGAWQFSPPGLPVVTPQPLDQVIAAERFRREGTGVTVEGLLIETTRESQALIASTGLAALYDPGYRCNFKTATGFVEIGAEQIAVIAKAVRAHVQACFDRELALLRAFEVGDYTEQMLTEGWPDSSIPKVTEPL